MSVSIAAMINKAGIQAHLKPLAGITKQRLMRSRLGNLEADHQKIWETLRTESSMTLKELSRTTGLHDNKIQFYLSFLERAGYTWYEPGLKRMHRRYWLIIDTGAQAPQRLRGNQAVFDPNTGDTYEVPEVHHRWPAKPPGLGSPEHKLWQAMRMLRVFTVGELTAVTELDKETVTSHVELLHRFTYLRQTESSMDEAGYMLPAYRNTGSTAPCINFRLRRLYDFKTREIICLDELEQ